jgi:hypothetical protein
MCATAREARFSTVYTIRFWLRQLVQGALQRMAFTYLIYLSSRASVR